MPLPTFVIAGAQKCGTTSLAAALRQHRQVYVSRPKELHFFDAHFARGLDWYAEQFSPRDATTSQIGEATPVYLDHPVARARTHPDAPRREGRHHPAQPGRPGLLPLLAQAAAGERAARPCFEEAVAAEPERRAAARRHSWLKHAYVDRGHYMDRIGPLVADHGLDRVARDAARRPRRRPARHAARAAAVPRGGAGARASDHGRERATSTAPAARGPPARATYPPIVGGAPGRSSPSSTPVQRPARRLPRPRPLGLAAG